ncbi:hypothetical protein N8385_05765 [Cyclobacteriaceae bacterium]|nr:hypothetical protein [bacterium]MDC1517211.1 hypothetical protein [Cyclobacteriaceae bacterium]
MRTSSEISTHLSEIISCLINSAGNSGAKTSGLMDSRVNGDWTYWGYPP